MNEKGANNESALALVTERKPVVTGFVVSEGAGWPLWLTVSMVAQRLSLGKTKVYELIDVADLPVVRVGRALRVPTNRFLKWVEEFEKQSLSV